MTDKEIIKALEYCTNNYGHCENCPYRENEKGIYCVCYLPQNALDLINRQQEKIEYMQGERETLLEDMQVRNNQVIEQQAEIDMLNAENTLAISERNAFQKSFYATVKENRQLKADLKEIGIEYERLDDEVTNGIEVCHECHEKYDKKIKQTKAEAIKEFAEMLKESNHGILSYCTGWVDFDDIDNLVKEMVGEGK